VSIKYFKITIKDDGGIPVVLDEVGRQLLGVKSVLMKEDNIVHIEMGFRSYTKRKDVFTISPIFEEKSCAAMRHSDGAMLDGIVDIIMDGFDFKVIIRHSRKESK
jgi:hypothetical protein